jgi:Arm DNA-binding domain
MADKVKKAKAGAHLGLQIFWNGLRSWETTRLEDTPENRDFLEAQAKIISREIERGTFDYLKHFPDGNKAHLFRREAPRPAAAETVKSYYDKWIERRANEVRPQQVKCEKSYFRKHLLPAPVAGAELGVYLSHGAGGASSQRASEFFEGKAADRRQTVQSGQHQQVHRSAAGDDQRCSY